ncbi:MAG: asparagine synthase (glutamine-hydrolyzing) [Candidatus Omnitrophica bacterium]|nr:asparagine synthase (glutamine-hydrolyzing) [Candidatus Omnitrophota bacterium]
MCGICGLLNRADTALMDERVIRRMNSALTRRGPDEEGYYHSSDIMLGVRRLSIIDLETGSQPIFNESRDIVVIANGEIYNFPELKKELISKGHRFYTRTDTEVIVHLYEEHGKAFPGLLNGMFSIALWDLRLKRLFIVRDRMGQKPLYYSEEAGGFIFASELKAIMKAEGFSAEIDHASLADYFALDYIPSPGSILKGVKKLMPGHILQVGLSGEVELEAYWSLDEHWSKDTNGADPSRKIRSLLTESVKKRLMSDVGLGVFLSGGIDSTIITALASELKPSERIKTFSISFEDKSFDESGFSRLASERFNTEHHQKEFRIKDMIEALFEISSLQDEPFADPSILPTFLLSKFARGQVKVALGGDGGDELFGGYPTYRAYLLAQGMDALPSFSIGALRRLINMMPVSFENLSLDFRMKRFINAFSRSPIERHLVWMGGVGPDERKSLFSPSAAAMTKEAVEEEISSFYDKMPDRDDLEKILHVDMNNYLREGILTKIDRASMYASLEVRSPFMDHELMEYALSIPVHRKLNMFSTKMVLKEAFKDIVPAAIAKRPKKGFGIPISRWITDELKDIVFDKLSERNINREGIFNYGFIKGLLDEHLSKKADRRKELWSLFMFQVWKENFLG